MTAEWLLPTLSHIQVALDGDLTLATLAARAGVTPWHFQRTFTALVGETPKQHVLRLRLERAALRLRLEDDDVLEVGLACGFASHTVFGRAFRRRFGTTPTAWRTAATTAPAEPRTGGLEQRLTEWSISSTTIRRLAPTPIAWLRHVGPYEEVPVALFDELLAWAPAGAGPMLGIALDAPGITGPEALRFDAAVVVPPGTRGGGRIGVRVLEGGPFAVTTHVGPFSTLASAYRAIVERLLARTDLTIVGVPAVERYLADRLATGESVHRTEVCVPVRAREA
jgi:AraC family transcriptional regulator